MNPEDYITHYLSSPLSTVGFVIYAAEHGKQIRVESAKKGLALYKARLELYTTFLMMQRAQIKSVHVDYLLSFADIGERLGIVIERNEQTLKLFLPEAVHPDMRFQEYLLQSIAERYVEWGMQIILIPPAHRL